MKNVTTDSIVSPRLHPIPNAEKKAKGHASNNNKKMHALVWYYSCQVNSEVTK